MKNLLRFVYFGEFGPTFKVRRTRVRRGAAEEAAPSHEEKLRGKVVTLFCWLLTFAFFICLGVIIYGWIIQRDVPEIIYVILSGAFGYIGGVVSVYFGLKQPAQNSP